jgi:alkanesulfonate monooxygenase SsuD/methylene tetrahydromethanopterin reductase-like flavin-dependent oxidoreductase (luciferase family)
VRIGYLIGCHRGSYERPLPGAAEACDQIDEIIEEGLTAERAGFHSLQITDRHGTPNTFFPGPEQLLTILARETERVAIGSYSYVATLFHPMRAAEQFSVIDNISQGRLYTTVSRGFDPVLWGQFGMPQEHLLGKFQEALKIWNLAFLRERFDFPGKYWQVEQGLLAPPPYQEHGWPLWGGGNATIAAIERCADYSTCWTCDQFPIRRETWEEQTGAYRRRAQERGKQPFIVMGREAAVADTFEHAARGLEGDVVPEMRQYFRKGIFTHHPDFRTEDDITAERVARHCVIGTAEQCIEQVERYREELGVDYITVRCRLPAGADAAAMREQIMRFGEEVAAPIGRKYPPTEHPAIPAACRW